MAKNEQAGNTESVSDLVAQIEELRAELALRDAKIAELSTSKARTPRVSPLTTLEGVVARQVAHPAANLMKPLLALIGQRVNVGASIMDAIEGVSNLYADNATSYAEQWDNAGRPASLIEFYLTQNGKTAPAKRARKSKAQPEAVTA